jgi:hypothetical protein
MEASFSASIQALYPDKFDVDEEEEYDLEDIPVLNLGAESVAPTPPPEPSYGYFPATLAPALSLREPRSRSPLITSLDQECGICLKQAYQPSKVQCCGKIFCDDHLHEHLQRTSNRCPSCGSHCDFVSVVPPGGSSRQHQRDSESSDTSYNSRTSSPERVSDVNADSEDPESEKSDSPYSLSTMMLLQRKTSSTIDPELAGGVVGKVLSIVALTLVFYVLFN